MNDQVKDLMNWVINVLYKITVMIKTDNDQAGMGQIMLIS